MKSEDREKLLALVASGHDPESAAVSLGLDIATVRNPGVKLKAALDEAHRVGTSRLRGKLLELGLENGDARALLQALERREAAEAEKSGVTEIQRVVIASPCPACGYRSDCQSTQPHKPSSPATDEPGLHAVT